MAHNTEGINDNLHKKANIDFTENITKIAIKFNIKRLYLRCTE